MTQNTAAATRIHPTSIPNSRFKALAPPAFTPAFTSAPNVLGRTSSPHCPRLSSSVDRGRGLPLLGAVEAWSAASRSHRGLPLLGPFFTWALHAGQTLPSIYYARCTLNRW
jgi:hypothetical protein